VLVFIGERENAFPSVRNQFERASFITRDPQIGLGLGMMWIECERSFVVKDGAAKIGFSKISVAQIVKKIWRVLSGTDQFLVIVDRRLEITAGVFPIAFGELRARFRRQDRSAKYSQTCAAENCWVFPATKLSSNLQTPSC